MPDSAPPASLQDDPPGRAEMLLRQHLPEVRGYLLARCRDRDLAEELTQEVASRVLRRSADLDSSLNAPGYLVTAARNAWRDWLRRELVRRRAVRLLGDEAGASPAADSELLEHELKAGLRKAIDALPHAQREVVELRHSGNYTFQQIADRLHRPLGTVLTQMRAALQRMHQAMEAYR